MAIHNESKLGTGPFVPINCGALPEGLVESELFGHVKGSFSGAIRDKKGRFELAQGGTIFLDEVADLPKQVQVKLLRFLQEGVLEKVGAEKTISVEVRVISATNKDLKQEVKKGNFREDLYYRLNVIPFDLPPLRTRKNDILLLCEHFLEQETKTHGVSPRTISGDALSILMEYDWPGNVRELENSIRFAVVKGKGGTIQAEDLPMEIQASHAPISQRGPSKKLDLETVKTALVKTGGNKAKAARFLGVGRATLYRFLDQFPEMKNV
jgi:transcriptional regulator with PAS, ATPase and Fis domain